MPQPEDVRARDQESGTRDRTRQSSVRAQAEHRRASPRGRQRNSRRLEQTKRSWVCLRTSGMFRTSPKTRSPAARQVILSHAGYSLTRRLQETAKRIDLGDDHQINYNTYNDNHASLRKLINLAAPRNTAHGSVPLFRFSPVSVLVTFLF